MHNQEIGSIKIFKATSLYVYLHLSHAGSNCRADGQAFFGYWGRGWIVVECDGGQKTAGDDLNICERSIR